MKRKPLQGVWTVVRFNWHLHAAALAFIVLLAAAGYNLTGLAAVICLVFATAALCSVLLSLAATWLAYDAGGLYQPSWLAPWVEGAETGATLPIYSPIRSAHGTSIRAESGLPPSMQRGSAPFASGYSPELWRGKPFETAMHVLFASFWAFLTGLFTAAAVA